jgi:hypothetical protein
MAYSNKPSRVNKSRNLTLANRPSGGNLRQRLNSAASLGAVRNTVLSPLGENSNLRREAFNRKQFDDTIDTSFSELGVNNVDPSTFDPSLATVGDFFTIYQSLFLQIPKSGSVNSHEFLIERSTEYTQFIAQQEEINALQEEISDLRIQNVELVADMANIVTGFETTIANLAEQGIG